jgi:hypothetical protein
MCNSGMRFKLNVIECTNLKLAFEAGKLTKLQAIERLNESLRAGKPATIEELDRRSASFQKLSDRVISQVTGSQNISSTVSVPTQNIVQQIQADEAALTLEQKQEKAQIFKDNCYKSGVATSECDKFVSSGNAYQFVALSPEQIAETIGVPAKSTTAVVVEEEEEEEITASTAKTHDFMGNAQGTVEKIPTLDELNCEEAVKLKLESSASECLEKISSDVMTKAEFERDLALKKIDNHYDELLPRELEKCSKIESRKERIKCRDDVKAKAAETKKDEISDTEIHYAIKKSKFDAFQTTYNEKFKNLLTQECGKNPIGPRHDHRDRATYRRCKRDLKAKFEADNKEEMNGKLVHVNSSELELDLVKENCKKGFFNFISSDYEECIIKQANAAQEIVANEEAEKERILASIREDEAQKAELDMIKKCEQDVRKEINKLLSEDSSNIIGKQFYLTSLKLSKEVLKARGANKKIGTLEDYIKSQNNELEKSGASPEVRKKILGIYQKHGKVGDANTISKQFSSFKSSVYYSRANRLNNDNISAYILADTINNKDTSLTELDAASAWLAANIRSQSGFSDGSAAGNLMNLSVQAYRNINLLYENDDKAKSEIDRKIAKSKADLEKNIGNIKAAVEKKYAELCGPSYFESDCWKQDSFNEKLVSAFTSISKDISKIEMKKGLKGTINGGFKFNFLPRELMK